MATRYAEKCRRSPQAPSIPVKTFEFLRCLSLGGRFGIPPRQFFSVMGGTTIFSGGDMFPHPLPTSHTGCDTAFQTLRRTLLFFVLYIQCFRF